MGWTLRGLDVKVLRTYQSKLTERDGFAAWSWSQDHVYRGSSLLASVKPSATGPEIVEHFHLDHLGTPRLKTNSATPATIVAEHKYLPYGEELTNPTLDSEVMQFTSHERDRDVSGNGNDLDYMHARYYTGRTGRFLSLDPLLGTAGRPQSWNRYSYVLGNPINLIDEYGLQASCSNEPVVPDGESVPRPPCQEEITVSAKDPRNVEKSQGSPSLRASISSFLSENGGPGPCDASCQVMQGVAEIRAPMEALERVVTVTAGTAVGAQAFSLFVPAAEGLGFSSSRLLLGESFGKLGTVVQSQGIGLSSIS